MLASGGGDGANSALAEQMAAFEEEKKKWSEQMAAGGGPPPAGVDDAAKEAQTMLAMEKEIAELMPKTKQLKQICDIFNRDMLSFDVSFQRGSIAGSGMGTPTVKVKVSNNASNEHVFIDPFEFTKGFSVLRDEMQKMRNAIENEREYMVPEQHDPVTLLFDSTFFLGACVIFPEFLIYNLETDPEDTMQDITSVGQGARQAGKLEISWTPLAGPEPEDWEKPVDDVLDPDELIGKAWCARCEIKGAIDLPLMVDVAYCQYDFWDFGSNAAVTFTTDTIECEGTSKPVLNYEFVHSIDKVTQEFIDFLQQPIEIRLYVSPDVTAPKDAVGTTNDKVVNNIKNGYQGSGSGGGGGGAAAAMGDAALKSENASLKAEKEHMAKEIQDLKADAKRLKLEKRVLMMASAVANKAVIANAGVDTGNGEASKACVLQ
eukprot:67563_4